MIMIVIIIACIVGAAAGVIVSLFIKNKIITNVITVFVMAISIVVTKEYAVPYYNAYTFADSIRHASPLINLIASNSPDDFNNYMAKVKQNIINDQNPDNIYLYTNGFISAELIKTIPNASNESVYNYLAACVEMDKKLIKVDPMLVLFIEYPDKFINKVNLNLVYPNVGQDTLDKLLNAKQGIIESAFSAKRIKMTLLQKINANLMFATIMSQLSLQYGRKSIADAFEHPDDPTIDKQKSAEIIIKYYEAILGKGKDNAGMIYKSLFLEN